MIIIKIDPLFESIKIATKESAKTGDSLKVHLANGKIISLTLEIILDDAAQAYLIFSENRTEKEIFYTRIDALIAISIFHYKTPKELALWDKNKG